jgi:hypothetical protein
LAKFERKQLGLRQEVVEVNLKVGAGVGRNHSAGCDRIHSRVWLASTSNASVGDRGVGQISSSMVPLGSRKKSWSKALSHVEVRRYGNPAC